MYICMYLHIYMYIWVYMYVCMYIYHIFFVHSSIDGHLGFFHTLAIVDSATRNFGFMCPFEIAYLYSWINT